MVPALAVDSAAVLAVQSDVDSVVVSVVRSVLR